MKEEYRKPKASDTINFSEAGSDYDLDSKKLNDPVNHPAHYTQGGIECIDAMTAAYGKKAVANFCICNAFKYLWRTQQKNGKEDIDKAIWYLNKYKELNDFTQSVNINEI